MSENGKQSDKSGYDIGGLPHPNEDGEIEPDVKSAVEAVKHLIQVFLRGARMQNVDDESMETDLSALEWTDAIEFLMRIKHFCDIELERAHQMIMAATIELFKTAQGGVDADELLREALKEIMSDVEGEDSSE